MVMLLTNLVLQSMHTVSEHGTCLFYRNEDLQEQLWAINVRDVKEYLSPDMWHRYRTTPRAGSLRRTRRHSSRSNSHKPEDCKKLIDTNQDSAQEEGDSDSEEEPWDEGGKGEGEGRGERLQRHSVCV